MEDSKIQQLLGLTCSYKLEMSEALSNGRPIILFGAGKTSEYIINVLKNNGLEAAFFCDNDERKVGEKIAGVDIIGIDTLKKKYSNSYIYITTQMFYEEIFNQLKSLGISQNLISKCDWICQFEWELNYIEFIRENRQDLERIYSMLKDECSKKVFINRMAFLITRERKYALDMREKNQSQYFACDIINYKDVRNFIDVGTYTGDSILEFQKYTDCINCRVFGFEPDNKLYELALLNLKGNKFLEVTISKLAVSDKNGVSGVSAQLGKMQTIESEVFRGEGKSTIEFETVTLDAFFQKDSMQSAFLKMDIEGAELAALKGAKEFITNCKPILAICIYHKAADIIEIPDFLTALNSKYSFYLRHYSDNQTETVLYAITDEEDEC